MKKIFPTILVVEDDLDDQILIKYTFKKIGVSASFPMAKRPSDT